MRESIKISEVALKYDISTMMKRLRLCGKTEYAGRYCKMMICRNFSA